GCTQGVDCDEVYDCWDHDDRILALTLPTYDCHGRLLDADILMNGADFTLTTVDAPACSQSASTSLCACPSPEVPCVISDVQNTLTHELGHVLGLDHTAIPGSTMAAVARPG